MGLSRDQEKAMFAGAGKSGKGIRRKQIVPNKKETVKGLRFKKLPWKMLSESERKILIPRIWNETLTKDQKRSAIDQIIEENNYGFKNDHWYDAIHSTKFDDLPKELQQDLMEHYKYRTQLNYDGSEKDNEWMHKHGDSVKKWQEAEQARLKSLTAKEGDMIRVSKGRFGYVIGRKKADEFPKSETDWLEVRLWKPTEMKGVVVQVPIQNAEVVEEYRSRANEIPYRHK